MVQWVLDALGQASQVDNIIIVGLSAKSTLTSAKPMHFVSNQGRLLANVVAGIQKALELNPQAECVLICTADIPTLKPAMVDWLITSASQSRHDLYYGVCPRAVMEKRFRGANRTFTRLKDIEVCGADVHVASVRLIRPELLKIWEQLIGNRKSPLRQASIIGLGTGWRLLTGQLTLEEGVERVSNGIGIRGRAIIWSQAEPAMDVDKPHQLAIVRRDLLRQQRAAEPKPVMPSAKRGKKGKRVRRTQGNARKRRSAQSGVRRKPSKRLGRLQATRGGARSRGKSTRSRR